MIFLINFAAAKKSDRCYDFLFGPIAQLVRAPDS